MIIECPSCTSRYLVPDASLAPAGREVRCANCGHEWFQEPPEGIETEDIPEPDIAIEEDIETDIAEEVGVKEEVSEDENHEEQPADITVPALPEDIPPRDIRATVAGYAGSLLVFVLFMGLMMTLKGPLTSAWPSSALVFNLTSSDMKLPGEDLLFEKLEAKTISSEDGDVVQVSGSIANLTDTDLEVPPILASLRIDGGEILKSWIIEPGQKNLPSGESLFFESGANNQDLGATSVNVTFAFKHKAEDKKSEEIKEEATESTEKEEDHSDKSDRHDHEHH